MALKSVVCAVALLLCCHGSGVCQGAPAPVQPGAPGQPTTTLTAVAAQPAPRPPSQADVQFMQDMIMHHGQAVEMTNLAKTRASSAAVKEIAAKIDLSQSDEIRWMKQWLGERGIAPDSMDGMPGMQMDHTVAAKPITTEADGIPVTHLGHTNAQGTAHTNNMAGRMAGMDHADMAGMDHSSGDPAAMDHSQMDHGAMAGMDHDAMAGMHHGSAAAAGKDPMDVAPMVGMLTPRQMAALRASHGPQFDQLFLTGMMQHHNGALVMVKDLFQQPGAGQDPQLFDFANDVDNTQLAEIDIMKGILRKVNP